jgi:hypothetical protein
LQLTVGAEAASMMNAAAELFVQDIASTGWHRCCKEAPKTRPAIVLLDEKLRSSFAGHEHLDFLVDLQPAPSAE